MRHWILIIGLAMATGYCSADDDTAGIYQPGPGISPPRVIHKVGPLYTVQARRALVQATAVLEVVVDERGKPGRISIISPIGFGLDDRAREAVSLWEFKPGRKDGKPVKTIATVTVDFRLFHRAFNPIVEQRRTAYNLVVEQIQNHRRTDQTLDAIRNLAQQKYPPAMYLYAKMLEAGDGFARDPDLALSLIVEAAGKNHPASMYEEGRMLLEGRRLEKDPDRGLVLVRNAAILHNKGAQYFLASEYEKGGLLPRSPEQARQYFRLCALQGETVCEVHLAKLLIDKEAREERDYLQAIAWLELAAERGDPQANLLLDPERPLLTESQIDYIGKVKQQIASMK